MCSARLRHPLRAFVVSFVLVCLLTMAGVGAYFSGQTSSSLALNAGNLDVYKPASVSASRASGTSCNVSWTPAAGVPGAVRYEVYDENGDSLAGSVNGTSTTVTIGSGAVRPEVVARVGLWSSKLSTLAAAPGCVSTITAPTSVAATAGPQQITVSWSPPSGGVIDSYLVSVTVSGGGPAQTCTVSVPTTTCAVTGLDAGVE